MSFDKALTFILEHEGGYVNDPDDPGGETKFGISKRQYPLRDIKNLTMAEAGEIYRKDYWNFCRCGELPYPIALVLFDSAVNQGQGTAVRFLQRALKVKADGAIGPQTMAALATADIQKLLPKFVALRAFAYATSNNVGKFGLGWFTRLAECHQEALTD